MDFEKQINEYEDKKKRYDYLFKEGKTPVILTAVHVVRQDKGDHIKPSEPYTAAICQLVGDKVNASYFIKSIDNGIDSNSLVIDEFKQLLQKKINDNGIKLLLDIHGASENHDFDIEMGTLNNLSADQSTMKTLIDCFNKNGIHNIIVNKSFKGGGVTRYIYENTNIDVIQIEINHRYRDINNISECQKVCDALTMFTEIYNLSR